MMRPVTWIAGLAGSAVIHAAGFGLYLATRSVDDPPEQSGPESKLQLDTVAAKTQDAQAQTPDADDANTAEADSTALDAGAIRQSTAQALATPQDTANTVTPDANSVPTEPNTADQLAAKVPDTDIVQQTQADAATLAAAIPDLQSATASTLDQTPAVSAAALETDALASVATPTTSTQASAVVATRLPSQTTNTATVSAALDAPTVVASANALPSLPANAPAPDVARVGVAIPTALPVEQSPTNAAIAQQSDAQGAAAPSVDTDAATAEQPPLPADTAKANLAWQFGDRLVTDPQALATIQAFMAPNADNGGAEVKDGLSDVLTEIDCARLSATFIPETGTLEMRGHIPDPSLRGSILSAMQAQVGDGIPVTTNLLHLPSPQCGALTGIADVGLPQSTDQFTNERLVGANTHAAEFPYTEGNKFQFEFTAPEYDAIVYVDYFDAAGKVVHLQPNLTGIDGIQKANSVVGVYPKQPGTNDPIVIGPPFGQEIAVAFAASEPLFDTPRPIIEDAGPYLEWLKERVADKRAQNPDFKGEWVYFFITTKPASQ